MAFITQATIGYVLYALLWGYFLLAKSKPFIHVGVGGMLMVMGFMIGLPPLIALIFVLVILVVNFKYLKAKKGAAA